MARPDEQLWNLFDLAQTGELQAAEARKLGMTVNPHYLSENVEDTREIAMAMELLPWVQEVQQTFGSKKIDSKTIREQFTNSIDPIHINFYRGMHALERTGLVTITKVDEPTLALPSSSTYSITRRALKADYQEVIWPYRASGLGCLGRVLLAGTIGVGVASAETAAFATVLTGVSERVAQGTVVVGSAMMATAAIEKTMATVKAARVYRQYRRNGEEATT
jgi:hypothetical protein